MVLNKDIKINVEELDDTLNLPEYYFIILTGGYGMGKTALMTALLKWLEDSYKTTYANYHLNGFKNFEYVPVLTEAALLNLDEDSTAGFSELYKYLNSRKFGYKNNIDITSALQEIRKRKDILIGDCADVYLVDNRVRDIFNVHIHCCGNMKHIHKDAYNIFKFKLVQDKTNLPNLFDYPAQTFFLDLKEELELYNTEEKINKKRTLNSFMKN